MEKCERDNDGGADGTSTRSTGDPVEQEGKSQVLLD
jgi:hypothetical protein